ncbi:hypothetical protein [Ornithinimicrobium pekingense]|uniref:DUF7847 domain-containing protein n=1 Tax=Ornithinimicrobium pekingense TaxID=384677 RepID=A0ABQ2F963_9MICO|nr:hypothetical protein [Ornithinimicrobium pekingense]GGK64772.1 hypothetical protein GCM10011509_11330 [Ornithinimicrobium pekingense]
MTDQPGRPPGDDVPPSGTPPRRAAPPPASAPGWGAPPPVPAPGPGTPAGAWHQLPPEELARLHQPGIVPLRPLGIGDVFGGALQTMRRNPGATVGTGFLVLALLLVPSYLGSLAVLQVGGLAPEDRSVLLTLVALLFSVLGSVALTGMIVHVVGEAVLGDRAGLGETWRVVRGRLPALLANLLLMSLLLGGVAVVSVVGFVLLGWLASEAGGDLALVAVTVVGMLSLVLLLVWAGIRMSLAPAAVVLERVGPWRGIRRAWSLTRGGQGWRVVGITLLASILTGIFTSAVQVPVSIAAMMLGGFDLLSDEGLFSPVLLGVDHLVQLVVGSFAIPFTAGVTALLYLDQRIRREGLETALLRAAQARAAARRS